jgi:hypothetical protein
MPTMEKSCRPTYMHSCAGGDESVYWLTKEVSERKVEILAREGA